MRSGGQRQRGHEQPAHAEHEHLPRAARACRGARRRPSRRSRRPRTAASRPPARTWIPSSTVVIAEVYGRPPCRRGGPPTARDWGDLAPHGARKSPQNGAAANRPAPPRPAASGPGHRDVHPAADLMRPVGRRAHVEVEDRGGDVHGRARVGECRPRPTVDPSIGAAPRIIYAWIGRVAELGPDSRSRAGRHAGTTGASPGTSARRPTSRWYPRTPATPLYCGSTLPGMKIAFSDTP